LHDSLMISDLKFQISKDEDLSKPVREALSNAGPYQSDFDQFDCSSIKHIFIRVDGFSSASEIFNLRSEIV